MESNQVFELLCPEALMAPSSKDTGLWMPTLKNAMEALKAAKCFKILGMALEDTGLSDRLCSGEPYTLFAPNDEAFQRVPKLAELLDDSARLKEVLGQHLVWGHFDMRFLGGIPALVPVTGAPIHVTGRHARTYRAKIVQPNLHAANCVIHGIDRVLMPENYSSLREAGAYFDERAQACANWFGKWIERGRAHFHAEQQAVADMPAAQNVPAPAPNDHIEEDLGG